MLEALLIEIEHLTSPAWWAANAVPLFNILMIDLTLAGDNAIVVGMAASRVHPSMRAKVIFWGIAGAVVLRILFSGVAQQMLQIVGLTLSLVFLLAAPSCLFLIKIAFVILKATKNHTSQ